MLRRSADCVHEVSFPASSSVTLGKKSEYEEEVIHLFGMFRNPLLRYVISLGLSRHDGEEIIQEVFLALFRHLQLERSRQNLRGWIFRVAHNLALKQRSANQRSGNWMESSEAIADL